MLHLYLFAKINRGSQTYHNRYLLPILYRSKNVEIQGSGIRKVLEL